MKTVLVSGGNRGIGLEICRQLELGGHQVIMGARNPEKLQNSNILVRQLDVTDADSIHKLFEFISEEYGKLDVLINNAGIGAVHEVYQDASIANLKNTLKAKFPKAMRLLHPVAGLLKKSGGKATNPGAKDISIDSVKRIMETNYYGPWRMIQTFIPLLLESEQGQVINVSSGMGELKTLGGMYPGYSLSKANLNALTIMFAKELKDLGIAVNAMCPGWVRTDMGGPDAPRTVEEGADTAVWLVNHNNIPTGKFFRDRKEIDW